MGNLMSATTTNSVQAREKKPIAKSRVKNFFSALGPGLITGASDDDPSGIATYATTGAKFGYTCLWTALITFPLMAGVQYICAKIGLVNGKGLAGVLKEHYPKQLLIIAVALLLIANVINAGTDIGAIAAGINLLFPSLPIPYLVPPIALSITLLLLFGSYNLIANTFKWLTLSLFAYIANAFFLDPDWSKALWHTFVPTIKFTPDYLMVLVAILGTTISPYLFLWQATHEVEEEKSRGAAGIIVKGVKKKKLGEMLVDVSAGMLFSNAVMYFIMFTTAATLFANETTDIKSAADAAAALKPFAGEYSSLLFATGMIGAGFLAIPILVGSSAYALGEVFDWRVGLDDKPGKAPQFYTVLVVSMAVAMIINYLGINPMDALFLTAVINGFLAPPMLLLIMLVANNKKVMGKHTVGAVPNFLGWSTTILMFFAAAAFGYLTVTGAR